jgi:anaphase-promoting complex subunit 6
MEVCVLEAL